MIKETMLSELKIKGYTIDIKTIDDTKHVTLNSTTAIAGYTLPRNYSIDFTDYEIQLDCTNDMLSWSGLRVKEILDYR